MIKFKLFSSGDNSFDLTASDQAVQIYPFVATVTYGGKLSDSFVGGTETVDGGPYRIMIPTELLERKAAELKGKGVYASSELNSHDGVGQIGEFSDAWVETDAEGISALRASGLLRKSKNSDLVTKIIAEARNHRLGFSYDIKDATFIIASANGEKFIQLTDFAWRGATILYRDIAAYKITQLAAMRAEEDENDKNKKKREEKNMEELQLISNAVTKELEPVIKALSDMNEKIKKAEELAAAAQKASEKNTGDKKEIGISELVAEIGKQFTDAVKPLTDEIAKLAAAREDKSGHRQTIDIAGAEFIKRYDLEKEGEEPTVEVYAAAINAVNEDNGISPEKRDVALSILGGAKRRLMKQSN